MAIRILSLFFVFFPLLIKAQVPGCTDPRAQNYDPLATCNDGSCLYGATIHSPDLWIPNLSSEIEENSGLIFFDGAFWTHNDSGNEACLFRLDTNSGNLSQKIQLLNVPNIDWEDISQDDSHIFVGDFGNNSGSRDWFTIYVIDKSLIPAQGDDTVVVDSIRFRMADKPSGTLVNQNHNYDCEAMLSIGDSLAIFSKNWQDNKTRVYWLHKDSIAAELYPADSFDVEMLVTAADYSPALDQAILLGYNNGVPNIWLLFDFPANDLLGGNKRKLSLANIFPAQAEAVCFYDQYKIAFSSEKMVNPARLWNLSIYPWTGPFSSGYDYRLPDNKNLRIQPNPMKGKEFFISGDGLDSLLEIRVFNTRGRELKIRWSRVSTDMIRVDMNRKARGVLFVFSSFRNSRFCNKLIVQ